MIQYSARPTLFRIAGGILDGPPEPVGGLAAGEPRWRGM